ncbi:L7Ae/L30e/S12e/Gadd45 family ribosomal protein, partial [Oscillibacter sp.]|uniref:L7Ae/L30e/S12e/Gadd45 family ribosomal protein n=1 Tax=Oscillibacter sp. TaxID=1945593 RepID=UPI002D7E3A03
MSGNNILSLLGLALRGGRLAVGEEPAALAAKAGQARLLLTSSDAAGNTLRRAEHLAEEGRCLYLVLPFTKAELGGALGRGSAAIAALTDLGLAAAVAERLAQADPERYGEAAARMALKRRRAKERKEAPRRDPPKREPPPQGRDRRPGKPRREEGR